MHNSDSSFHPFAQARVGRQEAIQHWLQERIGELLGVEPAQVDVMRPFNEYGLVSVDAVGLSGELAEMIEQPLSPTIVYDYPTIAELARYLAEPLPGQFIAPASAPSVAEEAIAIIGMACRFPGQVSTPETFWRLLSEGRDATTEIPAQRWDAQAYYDPSPDAPGKMYTRSGCFLDDLTGMDANFFGISPREATRMDPQQRLLLEVAWEAVENAGLAMSDLAGSQTGVFIGMMNNSEYSQLQIQQGDGSYQNDLHYGTGSASSVASGRLAYLFDWQGPTLTVDTACSSSLVSLHLACQSLRTKGCTLALVGGVHANILPETMVNACKMGMLAADGYCKTFDAAADGFVVGEGCGAVLLKPLADALADNNPVLAVIRGSAVNQDGRSNGMTAPNKLAQEAVMRQALARAGVRPSEVSYVEAHGSGTALGDPIEIAALEAVYSEARVQEQPLLVGSVKTNIGHLVGASGMAGLLKTVLSLQQKTIPPHLHLHQLNPHISRVQKCTSIPTTLTPWSVEGRRLLAGVSSFGWSGTNAHVILEEAPAGEKTPAPASTIPAHLVLLSAHTEAALNQATENLVAYMREHPEVPLADVATTLQTARSPLKHRRMLICREREDAGAILSTRDEKRVLTSSSAGVRPVAFLLPGVGEQYIDMALELYQIEVVFRTTVDTCCRRLKEKSGLDLYETIFSRGGQASPNGKTSTLAPHESIDLRKVLARGPRAVSASFAQLKSTAMAQPAAFVIEYALACLLETWGIRPVAMLGYSLGEYVAACLAGVFSLEDALMLVAQRAKMIQSLPAGAMVAVFLSEQAIQPYLSHNICLAAVNAPATCVLAGPIADIERLEKRLAAEEIAHRRIEATHAFHSIMLDPLRDRLIRLFESIDLHAPHTPYLSNVTGTWITADQATSPEYWADHMCQTVRFTDGVGVLLQETNALLLEIGPGQSLSSFVRQHALCTRERLGLVFSTLPSAFETQSDFTCLLNSIGRMWLAGVNVDWRGFGNGKPGRITLLPNYPFEHQRFWIERQASPRPHSLARARGKQPLADWFSLPTWRQAPRTTFDQPISMDETCWLIFLDVCGLGERVAEEIAAPGRTVVTVVQGTAFVRYSDTRYMLRPGERADYEELFRNLQALGTLPGRIVHLWSVTSAEEEHADDLAHITDSGFYSLFAMTQALGDLDLQACHITVVSNGMLNVAGDEPLCPEKALVLGPCRVIPQEYPLFRCNSIDIALPTPAAGQETFLVHQLVTELLSEPEEPVVALRGKRRWVQTFEPVRLTEHQQAPLPLREGGVYLITGGLGGIGLAIGEHFARAAHARLVLIGRTALPPRERWEQIVADDPTCSSARAMSAIQQLEAEGHQVLVLQADVTSEEEMSAVITRTYERFGALHGVVHAAGVPGMGLLQLKTRAQAERVLAPKVRGTRILSQVLATQTLDFLVLCSSITSITGGGPGQVDYAGASAFLDTYAQCHGNEHGMTLAIDWGEWQWNAWEAGLAGYDAGTRAFLKEHRARFGISFEEGVEALSRVLAARLTHVVVSPQDVEELIELSQAYTTGHLHQQVVALPEVHARPELATSYIAPRNDTERRMAALWGEQLGIEQVGINDNFFELGGNSLIGMELIRLIRKTFALTDFPPYMLYEAPTVRLIAQHLEQTQTAPSSIEKTRERSEKRRERRKQRSQHTRKVS